MRLVFSLAFSLGAVALAQEPAAKEPDPRFGVAPKLKAYPQSTAKKALASAVTAIQAGDTAYLLAHLMDPAYVESRVADRAKQYEAEVETRLARLRDLQIRNRDQYQPAERLPTDRAQFAALIVQESRKQAFQQLARDVGLQVQEDPESFKGLRRILADGKFEDTATGAKATHPDVKFRTLYFLKIGDRWFLENRQEEPSAPKKEPEVKEPEKKEPAKKGPGM